MSMFGKVDAKVHEAVVQERDTALASIETLNGEKETLTGQVTTLTTERDDARTELATAQNALTEAQNTIESLNTQVAELTTKLANRPGAAATEVEPKTETIETSDDPKVVVDPVVEFAQEKM